MKHLGTRLSWALGIQVGIGQLSDLQGTCHLLLLMAQLLGAGRGGECQPEAPALLITPMKYHWACASEPGAPRHSLALVPACSSARFTSATNEAVPFPLQATEAGTWASWAGCWLEGRGEEGALPLVETVICRPAGDPEPQPGWGKTSIWAVGG